MWVRIAVISDIHGNLPALEAVEKDLERQAADEVWCAGDLGWGGPWASECIAHVRSAGWTTVKGNTDVWLTGDPQTVTADHDRRLMQSLAEAHAISADDARWLLDLPLGHSGAASLLMVHGTPNSPFDAPMPDAPGSDFVPYEGRAALVVYGHVHRAFVRRLKDGGIVCNTGAVGFPSDDDTASYLLIDRHGPDLTLRHRRVAFDRAAGIAKARSVGNPIADLFLRNIRRES